MTPEEPQTLILWAKSLKKEQRLAQRARLILLTEQGVTLCNVSHKNGLGTRQGSKWRKRFQAQPLQGLADRPRSNRPPGQRL
ncbi:MAG: helix-turn-helix domain-containing protein [Desulfobaccales bacterium]|nr:helix-turn-helix domain-containing protein [Desulfobaccales bacterium]